MLSFFLASFVFSSIFSIICCQNAFGSFWVFSPELNLLWATLNFLEIVLLFELLGLRLICDVEAFRRILLLNSLDRKDNAIEVSIFKISALLIDIFNVVLLIVNGGIIISFLVSVIRFILFILISHLLPLHFLQKTTRNIMLLDKRGWIIGFRVVLGIFNFILILFNWILVLILVFLNEYVDRLTLIFFFAFASWLTCCFLGYLSSSLFYSCHPFVEILRNLLYFCSLHH